MSRASMFATTLVLGLLPLLGCKKEGEPSGPSAPEVESSPAKLERPKAAAKAPVKDSYFGVDVVDPYRWLEKSDDQKVKDFSAEQNKYARSVLDRIESRAAMQHALEKIMKAEAVSWSEVKAAGGRYFARKRQPPKQQPFIVVLESLDAPDTGKVVVDPNVLDPTGGTAIDWFVPSPDGRLMAVSISKGGTESGDVSIYDVDTAQAIDVVVPRVNGGTAGGDLAWAPDGKGYYYTRYPRGEERPAEDRDFYQQVWFHTLGEPGEKDRYETGKDLPRIAEIQLAVNAESGRVLATVQKGDGGEFAHFLRAPDGSWKQLTQFEDHIVQIGFGPKNDLLLISRDGAPRGKIQRLPIDGFDPKKATPIIPEGEDSIVSDFWGPATVYASETRLYVEYQLGGPSEIRVFDLSGKRLTGPEQPQVSSVSGMVPIGPEEILFSATSFVEPTSYLRYDAGTGRTSKTGLANGKTADFSKVEVVRELATSKDGTKVPVNILQPKGTVRDGKNPTIINGYGGYGVSLEPRYNPALAVLLDAGVVFAIANLRGGAEFGDQWHDEGRLTKKQNVFDDFIGVIDHLIAGKLTSAEHVGIIGGSNGGLLMGATFTQRPELAKVVVSFVGIYDMLRVELSSNGAFNVTEFGTVKDEAQFKALHAYSPYHHVKDGTAYPAILFITGENDPRVDPMQSRKMTARLQAAAGPKSTILLRTTTGAGHGMDTGLDERIAQTTDAYSFLIDRLGVKLSAAGAQP